jgi:hypothetical protein
MKITLLLYLLHFKSLTMHLSLYPLLIIIIITITVETVEHMIQTTADLGIRPYRPSTRVPWTMAVVAGLAFSPFQTHQIKFQHD